MAGELRRRNLLQDGRKALESQGRRGELHGRMRKSGRLRHGYYSPVGSFRGGAGGPWREGHMEDRRGAGRILVLLGVCQQVLLAFAMGAGEALW